MLALVTMLRLSLVLLMALVALPLVDRSGASTVHVMTGTVVGPQADQLISVANEQTGPGGVRIDLRLTHQALNRAAINAGARVVVSYRYVGERYPVAVAVDVLRSR
jgi:hypothetical protein